MYFLPRFLGSDPDSVIVSLCMSYFNRVLYNSGELAYVFAVLSNFVRNSRTRYSRRKEHASV